MTIRSASNWLRLAGIVAAASVAASMITHNVRAQAPVAAGTSTASPHGGDMVPLGTDSDWTLAGNGSITSSNFVGTTNNAALAFRVYNSQAMTYLPVSGNNSHNILGGKTHNTITASVEGAVIAGGGCSTCGNSVTDHFGVVGGGAANQAGDGAGTISDRQYATVGGGWSNVASGYMSVVCGGRENSATDDYNSVSGGYSNSVNGDYASSGGGYDNGVGGTCSRIGGGCLNETTASNATVCGGYSNSAAGDATVAGGLHNDATGGFAAIPGGAYNDAGGYGSFAAGLYAEIPDTDDYSFVWSGTDSVYGTSSRGAKTVTMRAANGYFFYTADSGTTTGVYVASGGGSWASLSDRASKENIVAIDPVDVVNRLDRVPISAWSYKTEQGGVRHMGPMAQDFHTAFGLGPNDTSITDIDGSGVALAAAQGLRRLAREQQDKIDRLERDNADLKARMDRLERALATRP